MNKKESIFFFQNGFANGWTNSKLASIHRMPIPVKTFLLFRLIFFVIIIISSPTPELSAHKKKSLLLLQIVFCKFEKRTCVCAQWTIEIGAGDRWKLNYIVANNNDHQLFNRMWFSVERNEMIFFFEKKNFLFLFVSWRCAHSQIHKFHKIVTRKRSTPTKLDTN